jgi:hypothetical protein
MGVKHALILSTPLGLNVNVPKIVGAFLSARKMLSPSVHPARAEKE